MSEEDTDENKYFSAENIRNRMLKRVNSPLLPSLSKVLLICMILCTIAVPLTDLVTSIRYGLPYGLKHMFQNMATSAFFTWLIFSPFLILTSALQMRKMGKRISSNLGKGYNEELAKKAKNSSKEPYRTYIIVSLTGILVFGILYLIFSLI